MKRLVSILLALALLALIYWQVDVRRLGAVLAGLDPVPLGLGLLMFVPLFLSAAYRLQIMLPGPARMSFGEAFGLTLSGQVLNLILPSKMGDIAKLFFIEKRGYADRGLALALVVFERLCDVLALLVWGLFGLVFLPERSPLLTGLAGAIAIGLIGGVVVLASGRIARWLFAIGERILPERFAGRFMRMEQAWFVMQRFFWEHPVRTGAIALQSIVNWFFNLAQVWVFALAIGEVSLLASLALAPLAILAGLLPFTFAGIGTRDAAVVFFFEPYLGADGGAALGLLTSLRYIVPAFVGLPFFMRYWNEVPAGERDLAQAPARTASSDP